MGALPGLARYGTVRCNHQHAQHCRHARRASWSLP